MLQNYYNRPQQMIYRAIPVSSEAEVNNITVDFNGMPTYFHNQVTNEIYIKQFDIKSGLTTIQKYIKFEADSKPNNESKEAEKENVLEKQINALNDRIDGLKLMIEKMNVKEVKNAK